MSDLIRPDWAGHSTMKRICRTPQQLIRKLNTPEQLLVQGKPVASVCRALVADSHATYHRWRQPHGGMQAWVARRLTQLEKVMLAAGFLEAVRVGEGNVSARNAAAGPLSASPDGCWASTSAPSAMAVESSSWMRPISGVVSGARKACRGPRQEGGSGQGPLTGSVRQHQAEHPHQVWAMDSNATPVPRGGSSSP